jgi:signal transduction histidine kinase
MPRTREGVTVERMQVLSVVRRDARAHVWDYALAATMMLVALVALLTRIDVEAVDEFRFHADTWWSWAATIAVGATLVGRRRWPLRSLAVALVLIVPLELDQHRDSVAFFVLVIGLYSVASSLPLRLAWRGVAIVVAFYVTLLATGRMIISTAPAVGNVLLATAFVLGLALRRGRMLQEREDAAAVARSIEALEIADLHAATEQLRMAQDLHDVVAHSLSVIAVQAGVGAHLIARSPGEAERALDAIRSTSDGAIGELTRLVDILKSGESGTPGAAPALHAVRELVGQVQTAGVPITFRSEGDVHAVPPGVSAAAYRIIQEALTNLVRHAGPAQATVTLHASDNQVELSVEDDGRGAAAVFDEERRGGGNGLVGMRERTLMYGGEIQTGPRPGGGFRVHATLPFFSVAPSIESPAEPGKPIAILPALRDGVRVPSWVADVGLAAALSALAAGQTLTARQADMAPYFTATDGWSWFLRLGCCAALVGRRRFPTTTLALVWLLGFALSAGDYEVGVIVFVLWVGLYSAACYCTPRRAAAALIGSYVGVGAIAWSKPPDLTASGAVWVAVLFSGAAVAGYVVRRDRLRRSIDVKIRVDAADAHSRHARLIVTTERLRIADELNTIIARSIQTIAHQAAEGSALVHNDPIGAEQVLQTISLTSRESLNDLRRLLKHMRSDTEKTAYRPITVVRDTR